MATPNQEAIDTFIGITGATAARKLEEHGGNLNEAVDAYFNEGDRNTSVNIRETPVIDEDDFMDVDDPDLLRSHRNPLPLLAAARDINPLSYLENLGRSVFDADITNRAPFVTHPREVREIPIEFKDDSYSSGQSGHAPTIDDVTGTAQAYGPGISGTVIVDDDDDDITAVQAGQGSGPRDNSSGDGSHHQTSAPSAPRFDDPSNDIEEQMIRAAIEASRREVEANLSNHQFGVSNEFDDLRPQQRQSHLEDPELAHVVSLSLKTAEQEKALRELGGNVRLAEMDASKAAEEELGKVAASNGSLETGSSSIRDDTEDVEEQPLVRQRSRRIPPSTVEPSKEVGPSEASTPSSPGEQDIVKHPSHDGGAFPSDEWGGMSSQEHDEAVMLEAAMFGGIPEGSGYRIPYAPHQFM